MLSLEPRTSNLEQSMNFFYVPPEFAAYGRARVVILPVPYEASTSYGKGTASGPEAIHRASSQVELYDEVGERHPYECGIHSCAPVDLQGMVGEAAMERIAAALAPHLTARKFPVVLGGEHSITSGVMRAVRGAFPDVGVVQLDAHGDLRSSYEGSPWGHASVMRRVVEMGCPTVGIGIRSLCAEERDCIREQRLPRWFAHQVVGRTDWIAPAIAAVPRRVFLTLDVDVFDVSLMPSTGTPEPGGMGWYEVLAFLERLFAEREVVGMDVVELAPRAGDHGSDFLVAKLIYKAIGYLTIGHL